MGGKEVELMRYEKRNEPDDELDGCFTGPYYIPLADSKYRNSDQEWIFKSVQSKGGKNETKQHLQSIFVFDSHPIGKQYIETCEQTSTLALSKMKILQTTMTNNSKRGSNNENQMVFGGNLSSISANSEELTSIAYFLWHKVGIITRSMVVTWPIYRDKEDLRDLIYNMAINHIYSEIFCVYHVKYSLEDRAFSLKSKDLSNVTPLSLGISRELCLLMEESGTSDVGDGASSYVFAIGAINLLKQLTEIRNVKEKMDCLVATVQLICNSVKNYLGSTGTRSEKGKDLVVSADDLLPMLCYVVLHCQIETLYSEMKFIGDFCGIDPKLLSGQEGYCISMLEGSIEHIMTIPSPSSNGKEDNKLTKSRPRTPSFEGSSLNTVISRDVQDELYKIFEINDETEQVLSKWPCNYNSLTKKGNMYITATTLYFVPNSRGKESKMKIPFSSIYTIRKAKFAIVDNAIEIVLKEGNNDKGEPIFIVHRFNAMDNRNIAFSHLLKAHQSVQLTTTTPTSDITIYDDSIDFFDPLLDLEFLKLKEGFQTGKYAVRTAEEVAIFVALLAQITLGDFISGKHKEGFVKSNRRLVPNDWKLILPEKLLFAEWAKLTGLSETICKLYFIQKAREVGRKMTLLYGLHIWFVGQSDGKKISPKFSPVILGITTEAILIMQLETLDVIKEYPLSTVQNYATEGSIFSMDFVSETEPVLHFSTNQGSTIESIIDDMIAASDNNNEDPYNSPINN
eukprot:TRINITY_DN5856_c0_g1_i1.p1 TRINITY_DN5856_c0_g1~~TRINITY_DN5856_c0_g1_i1.p1  ORF type:complete len:737 (-),score=234.99 TRINITY_DN5856_c0_g1_i1:412-2622(-)